MDIRGFTDILCLVNLIANAKTDNITISINLHVLKRGILREQDVISRNNESCWFIFNDVCLRSRQDFLAGVEIRAGCIKGV